MTLLVKRVTLVLSVFVLGALSVFASPATGEMQAQVSLMDTLPTISTLVLLGGGLIPWLYMKKKKA